MAFAREDNNRDTTSALWSSESVTCSGLYANKNHLADLDLKSIKNMIGVLWGHPYHYFLDIYVVVF